MINEFWQVRLGGSVPPAFPNLLFLALQVGDNFHVWKNNK
tara:strand:- start:317 stop:436 length:120 start_codon:yes stop_codon:yes gene_type:complete